MYYHSLVLTFRDSAYVTMNFWQIISNFDIVFRMKRQTIFSSLNYEMESTRLVKGKRRPEIICPPPSALKWEKLSWTRMNQGKLLTQRNERMRVVWVSFLFFLLLVHVYLVAYFSVTDIVPLKLAFNCLKQRSKAWSFLPENISNYPKQDPFQAISLANGFRLRFSANNISNN